MFIQLGLQMMPPAASTGNTNYAIYAHAEERSFIEAELMPMGKLLFFY